ncbi:hypothetical protein V1511DRAFT_460077 [Dipodascopsis uninucleata]
MAIDEELLSRCGAILHDPAVLEEEQADEIGNLIRDVYSRRGRLLTSSDLETLVLEVLWYYKESASHNSTDGGNKTLSDLARRTRPNPASSSMPISSLRKTKVVRGKFNFPLPAGRQIAQQLHIETASSSAPSTRSQSPDSLYNMLVTNIGSPQFSITSGFSGCQNSDDSSYSRSPNFNSTICNSYNPEQNQSYTEDDNEDDDEIYRPLTIAQQQKEASPLFVSANIADPVNYTSRSFNNPYDGYNVNSNSSENNSISVGDSQVPRALSTASSPSSPSTPLFSNAAIAPLTKSSSTISFVPNGVSGEQLHRQQSQSLSDTASPFDHIRSALSGPEVEMLSDIDITNTLERNGFDIYQTLIELADGLKGKKSTSKNNEIKMQTIGPVYSLPIAAPPTNGSSSKDPSGIKIPTVCRYFLTAGHCSRPDCRFTHDLSATVCRYWLQNSCLAGSTCVFLHAIPDEILSRLENRKSSTGVGAIFPSVSGDTLSQRGTTSKRNFTLKDESDFPALPSPSADSFSTRATNTTGSSGNRHGSTKSQVPSIKSMADFPVLGSVDPSPRPKVRKHGNSKVKMSR